MDVSGRTLQINPEQEVVHVSHQVRSRAGIKATALALIVVLAIGPYNAIRRADEAVFVMWRAFGDQLAYRELNAMARELEAERSDEELIRAARDDLKGRLLSLEAQREVLAAEALDLEPQLLTVAKRKLAGLDTAIALLSRAASRADHSLDIARDSRREREIELISLQAAADVRRMERALARPIADAPSWSAQIARTRDFLGTSFPDGEEPDISHHRDLLR